MHALALRLPSALPDPFRWYPSARPASAVRAPSCPPRVVAGRSVDRRLKVVRDLGHAGRVRVRPRSPWGRQRTRCPPLPNTGAAPLCTLPQPLEQQHIRTNDEPCSQPTKPNAQRNGESTHLRAAIHGTHAFREPQVLPHRISAHKKTSFGKLPSIAVRPPRGSI